MSKNQKGIVLLQVNIPETMRQDLYDEIVERCGYVRRGILGEIVTEAIREYLTKKEVERSKIIQKNELVRYNPTTVIVRPTHHHHTSSSSSKKKAKVDSDIYRILNEIYSRFEGETTSISDQSLRLLLVDIFSYKDKRTIDATIKQLLAKKVIALDDDCVEDTRTILRYKILITNNKKEKELPALT